MNIGFISLGCSKNAVDLETMIGLLSAAGHQPVADPASADVIIVNTCGFIEKAKREAIDAIFEAAAEKRGDAKLIVTGCLAQRHHRELLEDMPEVDAVLGIGEIGQIVENVQRVAAGARFGRAQADFAFCPDAPRILTTPAHRAYLKIADGCDNRCAYCAIPGIRGRYLSRPVQDIAAEARSLWASGVKEIDLVAQDSTRYGSDLYGEPSLSRLLRELSKDRADGWLRVLYCYPEMIDEGLLDAFDEAGACRYLDIPIQHVSEQILARMNRRGGRAAIEKAYRVARDRGFALRTTVLVGFPGETDQQFDELMSFLRDHPFDWLGAFAYSREEGTPAADMPDQVAKKTALARERAVMLQQRGITGGLLKRRVGTTCRALIEGSEGGTSFGRSQYEAPEIDGLIRIDGDLPVGEFVQVRIKDSAQYDLIGGIT